MVTTGLKDSFQSHITLYSRGFHGVQVFSRVMCSDHPTSTKSWEEQGSIFLFNKYKALVKWSRSY